MSKGTKILNTIEHLGNKAEIILDWVAVQSREGNYSDVTMNIKVHTTTGENKAHLEAYNYFYRSWIISEFDKVSTYADNPYEINTEDNSINQVAIANVTGDDIIGRSKLFGNTYIREKSLAWEVPPNSEETHTVVSGTFRVPHGLDGMKEVKFITCYSIGLGTSSGSHHLKEGIDIYTEYLNTIPRYVEIIAAPNFTDEDNPTITYGFVGNDVISLQAAIAVNNTGWIVVPYRDIPTDDVSYTFNLTNSEREALKEAITNNNTAKAWFITKVERSDGYHMSAWFYELERTLAIVGTTPILNPTVEDVNSDTLALTGDKNTFIKYESMAAFSTGAIPSKYATIVSQSVTCGGKTVYDLYNGVIDDVESGTFVFNVTDSRNMGASSSVFKNLVEYVKPTCYQKLEIEIIGETNANIHLTVNGNYYNGSFGAANNTLQLQVRYTDGNDNWGAWQTISGTPTYNGNTYELEATFTGFNYEKSYIFQCRATDKLNVVQSSQYTVKMLPVFDWSETDFNFNVPVNINAEDLSMNGETVLRHSNTTNNTVLSASNGHIYLRPGGTDDTSGQTIFYNNGSVEFSGGADFNGAVNFGNTVNFDYSFTVGGNLLSDYVVETGSEAMGTNGTWYWRKWLNGTAEAWGCRNFGNMAVTTAWGSLYRSAVFTQDLPDDVFKTTPDAININFVHTDNGGWISKYQNTAPSAITTGSFVVVRPVSGNITPTNIGFYVVGRWY